MIETPEFVKIAEFLVKIDWYELMRVCTNHEVDRSLDFVNVFDGRHVEHGGEGVSGGVAPVILQPRLIPGPVRNISDSSHAGERWEVILV